MSFERKKITRKYFKSNLSEDGESKFYGKNALGFSWREGQPRFSIEINCCTIDGNGVAEGLKLSCCRDVTVIDSIIIGGYEDCVDIVRGENIKFINCTFISNGKTKQHITCKGGAKNISFVKCKFVGSFRNFWNGACIDLGNWTDYHDIKRPKVSNIKIEDCQMKNVLYPVLYRRLYSESPMVENSFGFKLKIPKIFVSAFWFLQRKGLIGERRRFDSSNLKILDFEK